MKIAILSDIHALADCFEKAAADAEAEGFDRLVLLGDLLSYGTQVERTLDLAKRLCDRHDTTMILGNHDRLYFDLQAGNAQYLDGKPDWVVESAYWTLEQLNGLDVAAAFRWQMDLSVGPLYLAHANPFGSMDWTYIRDEDTARRAAENLNGKGMEWGVFGHVHRFRTYRNQGLPTITTVGSIGQPRDTDDSVPQWALATVTPDKIVLSRRAVDYDRASYADQLSGAHLSEQTRTKLAGFFA